MTGLSHRDEVLSAEAARVAAMKAVKAMDRMQQHTRQKEKNTDRFAQNAWGMIAICCIVVATTFTFLPGAEKITETLALAPVASFDAPKAPAVKVADNVKTVEILPREEVLEQIARSAPDILEIQNLPSPLPVDTQVTASVDSEEVDEVKAPEPASSALPDTKLGVDIGGSDDVELLEKRYAALQKRAPALFERITPLVSKDTQARTKQNRLIAGPFKDAVQLVQFCRAIRLRLTIECVAADYEGQSLNGS